MLPAKQLHYAQLLLDYAQKVCNNYVVTVQNVEVNVYCNIIHNLEGKHILSASVLLI